MLGLLATDSHVLCSDILVLQIMVLASRASGCLFGHPKLLKSSPQDTHNFCEDFSKNANLKHIIEFFHLHIIPMTLYKDIMPYFDKFIHVYG